MRGCKNLKNIVFPKNLKTIDIPKHCLDDSLSTLKPLVIPEGVKAVYVGQHCRNVAEISGNHLRRLNLADTAYLAGLLHDAGKCTDEFRNYLEKASHGEVVHRGSAGVHPAEAGFGRLKRFFFLCCTVIKQHVSFRLSFYFCCSCRSSMRACRAVICSFKRANSCATGSGMCT